MTTSRYDAFLSQMGVAATLALAAGLGSAYLVQTTAAEAWDQLTQPSIRAGSDPLMPIERVAVSAQDPSVVVWLGDNARYQRDLANVKETWALPEDELRLRRVGEDPKGTTTRPSGVRQAGQHAGGSARRADRYGVKDARSKLG